MAKKYWLMKSEPSVYSIDDLKRDKATHWDGVRNYQARNFMRDEMSVGDEVFFYHSNAEPPGIAGIAEVCRAGYPDPSAFDPKSQYYDEGSKQDNPRWYLVDIKFKKKFKNILPLDDLRQIKALAKMPLLQKGQRLSVQPVEKSHWDLILSKSL